MTLTSVTRLRVRRLRYLPAFLWRAHLAQRQAVRSDGFLGGYLALGPKWAFWTVTVWRDEEAMRAYRRAGAHLKAMPKLLGWCDEAAVAGLVDAGEAPLTAAEAAQRLGAEGRTSKVRHPSEAHRRGEVWPDGAVPRVTQVLRPR